MSAKAFYAELKQALEGNTPTIKELARLKTTLCKKHGVRAVPTNIEILSNIPSSKLVTKPMRTQSGVVPIAVMTRPERCPHGKCTFCPGGIGSVFGDVPQSYTGNEPSTMRAIRNKYDSYLIVMNRLEHFILLGHEAEKVELIIQGGTFPAIDKNYQEEVITNCFKALNDFGELFYHNGAFNFPAFKEFFEVPGEKDDKERLERIQEKLLKIKNKKTVVPLNSSCSVSSQVLSKHAVRAATLHTSDSQPGGTSLEEEQVRNETTQIRCIGLTIETKPDWGLLEHGNWMLHLGCTRVEVGLQTIYDDVLKETHRGHTLKETKESLQVLKDLGLKINTHIMPGLPGVDYDKDLAGLKELFTNSDYRPDNLKIYPCQVSPGTPLYYQWKKGEFKPLNADDAAKMLAAFKETIPEYCRVHRILRDVPTKHWADGVEFTNLRQYIHHKYKPKCKCIRCREPKGKAIDYDNVVLKRMDYDANKGKEIFLQFVDTTNDFIVGFCRLRKPHECLREEITPRSALIRELHVNGTAIAVNSEEGPGQHRGYGGKLLAEAERIAKKEWNCDKMVVISGVGVKEYYKMKGYTKEGVYVVRGL